ncbi:MAG TPA: N-acetylmuramoyl-L-alanine amidase [Vicinamibacterales bacterium]|nr:N-acetylmuramoyl-L-alanine amidase [Vicinamibacterales bacterium]
MKSSALLAAIVAALAAVGGLLAAQPAAAPYTVVMRDGRRPLPVTTVGGQEMFALDDLARLLGLSVREDALAGGLAVTLNGQTIVMAAQQPLASVAGRMISLPAPPVRQGRTWYVPVDFVSRALAPIAGTRIELRKASRLLLIGDVRLPQIALHVEPLGAVTRLTFEIAPPTPHTIAQEPGRLVVHFDADALDLADLRATPTGALQGVHAGDAPATIAVDLGPGFASYHATDEPADRGVARLVIDLAVQTPSATPQPPVPPAQPPSAPPLLGVPPSGGLRTIVLDPGHGGDDAGARGARGTLEKDVTLAVARRLAGALETRLGARVILTRDGDQALGPDERAAAANNNKADLFVSLHANASLRAATSGAEVFSLSLAEYGEQAQRLAHGETDALPVLGGGSRDIDVIPWDLAQARHIDQSTALAHAIEGALREHVPMSARALEQAPFRVLVGANMPAVLVEMGFLTNAAQERQLASDDFQNTLAQSLLNGILRYRDAQPAAPGLAPVATVGPHGEHR